MRRKPTNRTSYKEVCALYEKFGRSDYRLRSAEDILNIHGFDIRETDGYEDLTQEQKELFESYCVTHMNSLGMNTKITMWPKSVHYVKEYDYYSAPEWDEDEQRNIRWEIGREWIILKANGWTKERQWPTWTPFPPRKRNIFVWTGNTRDAPNGSTLWPRINTIKAVIL